MNYIYYEFTELDSEQSFASLGRSLGGVLKNNALCFNNHIAKGELLKSSPDNGLWIRKWKFTVLKKIVLHKLPALSAEERKFILVYFLNPAIFHLKNKRKNIRINGSRSNMFITSEVPMDFSVVPKQPFYVVDITFTATWLAEQLSDGDESFKNCLEEFLNNQKQVILTEPCTTEEYKILHELELSMLAGNEDILFIRSRVYHLIMSFFSKVVNKRNAPLVQATIHYEQVMQAEMMIMENIKKPPTVDAIAKRVNMSVSSLLRQFKLVYGKSIHEYYVEKKMELAKKMILEKDISVKEMAEMLGYNQPSPFIETFTKQHGCSPGSLKLASGQLLFV
jgi:AraC-like DNA-binding protein